jgi:urease accessory protein
LIVRADHRLTAVKLAREGREASKRTGRALLRAAITILGGPAIMDYAELVDSGRSPGNHAVAYGLVTAGLGIPRVQAVTSELYAFSAAWVAAAVRLALTDHHTAQTVLHQAGPAIASAARRAAARDVKDISSCTPLLEVMAMRHEETDVRLFAS